MADKNRVIPKNILVGSIDEKVDYFQSIIIGHTIFMGLIAEIKFYLSLNDEVDIILVIGPTGAGKSRLRSHMLTELIESKIDEMEKDLNHFPYTYTEALSPEKGSFDLRTLYAGGLRFMKEPLIDNKVDLNHILEKNANKNIDLTENRLGPLKASFYDNLIARNVIAFLIDEGQNIVKTLSSRNAGNHLDSLKSIVNVTNTKILLFATYEFKTYLELNAQLSRRTETLHFKRYDQLIQDEREDFKDVVNAFQKHLPLKKEPDLIDDWEYLYLYSAGCVGILKNWLTKSLRRALEDNERKKFKSYLEKHQMKNKDLRLLLASIEKGEQMMLDEDLSLTTLEKFGFGEKAIKTNSNSKGRVGTRNPQRDPVGTNG